MTAGREHPRAWVATRSNVDRAHFLRTGRPPAGVRSEIADSWRRSVTMDPGGGTVAGPAWTGPTAPHRPAVPESTQGLRGLARRVNEFSELKADASHLVLLLTGPDALIVARQVAPAQARSATDAGLFPGQALTEAAVGTNAVAVSMATGREARVVGAEHLLPEWTAWSSTAGAVRDPTGEAVGHLAVFEHGTEPRATLAWLRLAIALVELELRRSA
jgi:transcriptional regulator of acetoin/glycerol metabolism